MLEFKNQLLNFFPRKRVEKILDGIKNPLRNKWIIVELERLHQEIELMNGLNNEQKEMIIEFIEDQIAFCKYALQDSKCNPFKYIKFH